MEQAKRKLEVDFLYLDLNTCERCKATDTSLHDALAILSSVFYKLGYELVVNKVEMQTSEQAEQYRFLSSPTIRVNGVDIFGDIKENDCEDCGELCGSAVDCRVFTYEGVDYDQPPTAMIVDGILRTLYGHTVPDEQPYIMPDNLIYYFMGRDATMKTMSIYEPAMCCETGLCGVGIDPELMRISTVLNALKKNGVAVNRFNLNSAPMAFVNDKTVNEYINAKGPEGLPVVLVDGQIVLEGRYPANEEFMSLLDVPESYLTETKNEPTEGCGCADGQCC